MIIGGQGGAGRRLEASSKVMPKTEKGRLRNASTVTITFRKQKKGDRGTMVTQHRNENPN
jgi:hypothetical protein